MEYKEIKNITIVGAGLMGQGIAIEFALAGFNVKLNDKTDSVLQESLEKIDINLNILKEAGYPLGDKDLKNIKNIKIDVNIRNVVKDADLVIESVYEDLKLKHSIFKELDEICSTKTILASNTSSFLPSTLASVTNHPERVLVVHFFNPPYLLPLVEIVGGDKTNPKVADTVYELLIKIGKKPIILNKEIPGFIANRLQAAIAREAISIVEKGIATYEEVDEVIKNSIGRRYQSAGLFELADFAGLDIGFAVISKLFTSIESSTDVPDIFEKKIQNGELGVKTGKGFYEWSDDKIVEMKKKMFGSLLAQYKKLKALNNIK